MFLLVGHLLKTSIIMAYNFKVTTASYIILIRVLNRCISNDISDTTLYQPISKNIGIARLRIDQYLNLSSDIVFYIKIQFAYRFCFRKH